MIGVFSVALVGKSSPVRPLNEIVACLGLGKSEDGVAQAEQTVVMLLSFAEKNPGMTRVLIGEALVNEDERLQARINQLTDKLEAALRQSLRIAQAANAWHGDAQADAAVLIAYVLGRWQLFAKSGFKRTPQDGWALQRKFLFG